MAFTLIERVQNLRDNVLDADAFVGQNLANIVAAHGGFELLFFIVIEVQRMYNRVRWRKVCFRFIEGARLCHLNNGFFNDFAVYYVIVIKRVVKPVCALQTSDVLCGNCFHRFINVVSGQRESVAAGHAGFVDGDNFTHV